MKKLMISLLFTLSISKTISAQWECPSQLAGALRQIRDSNISWGIEIAGGSGYITNSAINNGIGLLGLNYTQNQHTFYFEGGVKYWYQGDYETMTKSSHTSFGLRELFYKYQGTNGTLTLGLQSMRSDDYYLLNERVLGFDYRNNFKRFSIDAFGGTVSTDFARNGTFCDMAYLYDVLPFINQPHIGMSLGQTNLAGLTLGFHPSNGSVEFSENLIGSLDEESKTPFKIETVGFAAYSEFGGWVPNPNILTGFYSNIQIGKGYWFKPEILTSVTNGFSLIYSMKTGKTFNWQNSSRTTFELSYYGFSSIGSSNQRNEGSKNNNGGQGDKEGENKNGNSGGKATNLFSNIFAGTVLRFDAPNMPFGQIAIKHNIQPIKTHLKIQYSTEVKANPSKELDIELGKKFYNKLLINGHYGYISSPQLTDNPNLFRVEMRFTF